MIIQCTRGFGKVEHPETGEEINVEEPFEADQATFEALDAAYPGFEIVEADADPEPEGVDTSDEHWRTVVSAIEAGEYDDVLDDITDGRESVQEAIRERQTEL